jgi:hypothetical protein
MINKRPLKPILTGLLVALGLTANSLCLATDVTEKPVEKKTINTSSDNKDQHTHHHPENKPMKNMDHHHMDMDMDTKGMVMYENKDTLPKDCTEISEDVTIKVRAGTKFAEQFPGTVFGYDEHQWQVKPCSRITVELTNDDDIRHQWMIHGLPKYLYPEGMFHIELFGSGTKTGTFIVPSSHYTYLVHCDIAQHTEKGMKAQLKAGNGRGDLPSIPGISDPKFPD